jgi:hypothetical protein
MKPSATLQLRVLFLAVVVAAVTLALVGCTYRLPVITPPSQERIRIVAKSPDLYAVRVDVGDVTDYHVPTDGRVIVGIPVYRPTCGVYLFNLIKVGGSNDPLGTWSISVTSGGKTLRKLSVKQANKLATDLDGYHLLKLSD